MALPALTLEATVDYGAILTLDMQDGRVASVLLTSEQLDALSVGTTEVYNRDKKSFHLTELFESGTAAKVKKAPVRRMPEVKALEKVPEDDGHVE